MVYHKQQMDSILKFNTEPFINALQAFFKELQVPVDYLADEPALPADILGEQYKSTNEAHKLIADVYALGMVNDAIFENKSGTFENLAEVQNLEADYDGLLIFGVTLNNRQNNLAISRSHLAEITRAFNRAFPYTPVTIIFKYGNYLSLANSERIKYKQEWREGEKVGKVSLLRDIDITNTHAGHHRILNLLAISRTGKNAINSFSELYKYWQSVLSVSVLNKAFYNELQNWYFWAIQEVNFPNPPLRIDFSSDNDFDEALKEHKGKNVIRLLTRILFIWFIKEKGLIPEEIFDEKIIANQILNEFVPQKPEGIFLTGKQNSKYYRAILQNLFFATLNQPCKKRAFRTDGQHQNVTQLMRYKNYFKDANYFVELMETKVPFMNGGLFECLDKPHPTAKGKQGGDRIIYVDGFSDKSENDLLVPDYLFFDADEEVDLSNDLGNAKFKKSKTRGLIAILKSYKFTITENTPIDEDVALDPELLGKVFENLLASYNPETKTTARKQTGSFYTPREIVDYMVDESLIAYLKNNLSTEIEQLDEHLHQLVSYSNINPFAEDEATQKAIIKALDKCTILDPACGSGAYPMGILQKMVHILHKIDTNNTEWKNRQLQRVDNAIAELELLDDTTIRENAIRELEAQKRDIEESFTNNELDYGRKLYLIENCIFGVDIQPIATQISKLRFFISLVVDQKVNASKENFGVRPLPNLETKFVAANTLIGIEKPKNAQTYLFDRNEVQKLEKDLKKVRQRLFSAKTPSTKRALREQDKALREAMGDLLIEEYGNATARQLANWDPYDQNTTSPFFDKEWMFDIQEGFDIVIGNPPYGVSVKGNYRNEVQKHLGKVPDFEIYYYFVEVSKKLIKDNGMKSYIIPNTFLFNVFASDYRKQLLKDWSINIVDCTAFKIFDGATVLNAITFFQKGTNTTLVGYKNTSTSQNFKELIIQETVFIEKEELLYNNQNWSLAFKLDKTVLKLIAKLKKDSIKLGNVFPDYSQGLIAYDKYQGQSEETIKNRVFHFDSFNKKVGLKKNLWGEDVNRYIIKWNAKEWIDYNGDIANPRHPKFFIGERVLIREITNPRIFAAYTTEELYHDPSIIVILGNEDSSIKLLLSLLNSKLLTFYHFNSSPKASKGAFPKILVEDIKNFPIKKITSDSQQPFIDLVDKILTGKKAGEDTLAWEDEIDLRVYKLYELTHEEVLIIDPSFGMSAEEYEAWES